MTLTALIVGVLVGFLTGIITLARWWIWRTNKPEVAREMLKSLYRKAHPHWLQMSEHDARHVCPCCGWSETEGLVSSADKVV